MVNAIIPLQNKMAKEKKKMPTVISPEITERSPWWIPRQRYYELKHFCLQYPDWKIQVRMIDGIQHQAPYSDMPKDVSADILDQTARMAEKRARLTKKIEIVERAALEAGEDLCRYVLKSITEGIPYSVMQCTIRIPCNRNEYYDRYRKFFYVLDKLRD